MKRIVAGLVVFCCLLSSMLKPCGAKRRLCAIRMAKSVSSAPSVFSPTTSCFPQSGRDLSQAELRRRLPDAVPVYELSNFEVGYLSAIKERPLGDFVTLPAEGQHVLRI